MSTLQVNTLESNNTLTANSVTIGNATINASGITAPTYVVNTSAVAIGNSSANITITANSSVNFVVVNNAPNVFPNPLDIYAWASLASSFNNCVVSRDTTIPLSPAGGIPFKITPTAGDPHPSTFNANTWNLAKTDDLDIWKLSAYIRANNDITLGSSQFLLILPANSSGNYGTAGVSNTSPSVTLKGNTWTYFETIFQINGNANTNYIQIRPDGPDSGVNDFWYDGLSLQKVVSNTYITETVNTQLFTANGTWTKPSWATDGKELVIVHMWGGGGGSAGGTGGGTSTGAGGGGGAYMFGCFIANNLSSTQAVVVGLGGLGAASATGVTVQAGSGKSSTFAGLIAYGGGGGTFNSTLTPTLTAGGGGGWFSAGSNTSTASGGAPLGGTFASTNSTFGGGAGSNTSILGGYSVYGGGGGGVSSLSPPISAAGGSSIFGGGGGFGGTSVYGGSGGNRTDGIIPGGGAGTGPSGYAGARGEVRVYTYRIVS